MTMSAAGDDATGTDGKDDVFRNLNALTRELPAFDERGLVLALAAFAEDNLGELLKTFLIATKAATDLLEGFNAPLGTLSSRIKAAFALGLITKDQFEDLERLRKIRNEFSHTWKPISFNDDPVRSHIRAMNYSRGDDEYPETGIEKVRTAIGFLLVELQVTRNQIRKAGLGARVIGTHLITGAPEHDAAIETAQARLADLELRISNATGEKLLFYQMVRERWVERLSILERRVLPSRKQEVVQMREKLLNDIARSAPNASV
ncbi:MULTISPECIES: MltR family transcriptional regulator [unclassified Bradyrhizobium]|uniref:MltR family transcriptional regulator n=1 Tax=unclassified Bradyrhizobium TaxID=2631580 RepID=UPI002915F022|nr:MULTISPECIES: MltR family transcriptional regulator [unclassified Bradyrhizobium]